MRVHVAGDHAAYELKQALVGHLEGLGHEVVDHGPHGYDPEDDYPVFCLRGARAVVEDAGSLGVVLGGSGNGEQIAANKVRGVRAALAWNVEVARLARRHNDANVVSVGARQHATGDALAIVEAFLGESFAEEERHARRIAQLARYEEDGVLPPGADGA
jgi:ribose 5-phosphate isomerase B